MKTSLYIFFIVLLALCSCKKKVLLHQIAYDNFDYTSEVETIRSKNISSNNYQKESIINKNKKEKAMYPTKLDNQFEKIDIEWLHKNATEKEPMGQVIYYDFKDKNDSITVIISGDADSGYNFFQIYNNDYIALSKEYYPNGNIKSKGILLNELSLSDNYKLGIWYYFNEEGQLIKTIDYDKPFTFTFNDVLAFCRREKIKLLKGNLDEYEWGFHTTISRIFSESTGKCKWMILHEKTSIIDLEEIVLDGKTGKVVSRTKKAIEGP